VARVDVPFQPNKVVFVLLLSLSLVRVDGSIQHTVVMSFFCPL